jgi:hypothetical protein
MDRMAFLPADIAQFEKSLAAAAAALEAVARQFDAMVKAAVVSRQRAAESAAASGPEQHPIGRPWKLFSPERDAILRRDWPQGVDVHEIVERVNLLAGPAITCKQVKVRAITSLNLHRPFGYKPGPRRYADCTVAPAVVPTFAAPPPAAVAPQPTPAARPARIVTHTPEPVGQGPGVTLPTERQRQRAADDAAIARHIAERGVTRCPVAAADATSGTIDPDARAFHAARHAQMAETRLQDAQAAGRRVAQNRARRFEGKQLIEVRRPSPVNF